MADKDVRFFRANILALTKNRGSVAALVEKSAVSRSHIMKIRKGTSVPTLDIAVKLADGLGFSIDELLMPPKQFAGLAKSGANN